MSRYALSVEAFWPCWYALVQCGASAPAACQVLGWRKAAYGKRKAHEYATRAGLPWPPPPAVPMLPPRIEGGYWGRVLDERSWTELAEHYERGPNATRPYDPRCVSRLMTVAAWTFARHEGLPSAGPAPPLLRGWAARKLYARLAPVYGRTFYDERRRGRAWGDIGFDVLDNDPDVVDLAVRALANQHLSRHQRPWSLESLLSVVAAAVARQYARAGNLPWPARTTPEKPVPYRWLPLQDALANTSYLGLDLGLPDAVLPLLPLDPFLPPLAPVADPSFESPEHVSRRAR